MNLENYVLHQLTRHAASRWFGCRWTSAAEWLGLWSTRARFIFPQHATCEAIRHFCEGKLYSVDFEDLFFWQQASLATSVTTALSFFANLASVIRLRRDDSTQILLKTKNPITGAEVLKPLREFGFFMGEWLTCLPSIQKSLLQVWFYHIKGISVIFATSKCNEMLCKLRLVCHCGLGAATAV